MRRLIPLLIALQIGCGSKPSEVLVDPAESKPAARISKIPVDVTFTVIKDVKSGFAEQVTRYVDFRLNKKVSKQVLTDIATEVMAREPYRRIVSFYYLPATVEGVIEQPWASTDYRPELEVRILGLTVEDEAKLRETKIEVAGDKIGTWLVEMQGMGHIAVIVEDVGPKLARFWPKYDPSPLTPMVELPADKGRRFQVNGSTEVYEVDPAGVLRMVAADGRVFAGAMPLR